MFSKIHNGPKHVFFLHFQWSHRSQYVSNMSHVLKMLQRPLEPSFILHSQYSQVGQILIQLVLLVSWCAQEAIVGSFKYLHSSFSQNRKIRNIFCKGHLILMQHIFYCLYCLWCWQETKGIESESYHQLWALFVIWEHDTRIWGKKK